MNEAVDHASLKGAAAAPPPGHLKALAPLTPDEIRIAVEAVKADPDLGGDALFENIDLRGDSIVMQGAGSINFDNKKVALTFNTDSPSHWIKLPIVADFWQSAKRELFQITVRGTVEEPKVLRGGMIAATDWRLAGPLTRWMKGRQRA